MKRGLTPYLLGTFAGVVFGTLLTAYLFITGTLDVTASGFSTWAVAQQALPVAIRAMMPWLLIWLFVTPALLRIPFAQPWLALVVSAAFAVVLVPRMLDVSDLAGIQLGAIFVFALITGLPVVRANDVALVATFFATVHIIIASIMGMPFGALPSGILASRLHGDPMLTGGDLGPVFGFAGVLGQFWLAGFMLRHQHVLFAGARARVQPRAAALRQLLVGLLLAAAATAVMFVLTLVTGQSRIGGVELSLSPVSASLVTALPAAIASAFLSCFVGVTLAWAVVRKGWIAAAIATAAAVALHLQSPGTNAYSAAGVAALTFAMTLGFAATARLWLPVGLAYGWLLFEGPIFGFPTNGFPIGHPWFQQEIMRYTALGGGILGPAASVFATAAKCLLVVGVILFTRREK